VARGPKQSAPLHTQWYSAVSPILANRGRQWGWGWTPDPRQIGGGKPTPDPRQIGARGGGGDRGFRALNFIVLISETGANPRVEEK
jgi:hypothetical protein